MKIQWINEYKTGIEEIDIHHEGMFDKINSLLSALNGKINISTIKTLVIIFESFLVSHFALEESLQQKFAYPDYKTHHDQHTQLIEEFSGLMKLIETEGTAPHFATTARDIVMDWWESYISHVTTYDQKLAEFLKIKMGALLPR